MNRPTIAAALALAMLATPALAQSSAPAGTDMAAHCAARYPEPARAAQCVTDEGKATMQMISWFAVAKPSEAQLAQISSECAGIASRPDGLVSEYMDCMVRITGVALPEKGFDDQLREQMQAGFANMNKG